MARPHPVPRIAALLPTLLRILIAGLLPGLLAACTARPADVATALPTFDAAAQQARYTALQQTLERNASGSATRWGLGTIRGSTVPLGTFSSATYGWCRDYEERIAVPPARNYRMVGIACRDTTGTWLVVDIRPFIETTATARGP